MQWLEDITIGIFAAGVNNATFSCARVALVACFLLFILFFCLFGSGTLYLHSVIGAILSAVLFISLSWFVTEVGIVSAEDQRKELYLENAEDSIERKSDERTKPLKSD